MALARLRPLPKRSGFVGWLLALLCLVMSSSLSAATVTWDGGAGTGNWADGANWDTNVAPVANDDLVFAGSTQLSTTNNIATVDISFNSITFAAAAGAFTLGGSRITLAGNITNSSSNNQAISLPIILNVATCTVSTGTTTLTMSGVISETGGARAITKSGAGTLQLGINNVALSMTFSGGITISAGTCLGSMQNNAAFGTGAITIGSGTKLWLNRQSIANNIVNNGGTIIMDNGFPDTISGTITNNALLTIDCSYVSTHTISGNISGAGGITVIDSFGDPSTGVILSGASNTYTGATTVSSATLKAGSTSAFGTNSAITLANNSKAILDITGFSNSIGSLAGGGATGGNVTLGAATLTVGADGTSTSYDGVISGTGAVTKTGAGTQTLTRANTYTGATTITAGVLSVGTIGNGGVSGNMGAATNAAANLVFNGGTLQYTGSTSSTDRNFTLTAATTGTFDITTNTLTMSGASTATTGALTKIGNGTLILSGTNLHTGATTITAGTLSVATIGNGGVSGNLGAATNAAANLVLGGGTLQYTGATASTDRNFTLTAATTGTIDVTTNTLTMSGADTATTGALTKIGAGTLVLTGANLHTGTTTITAGILQIGSAGTTGSLSTSSAIVNNATLYFNRSNNITQGTNFASVISGTGAVTQAGTSANAQLILNGTNTYTGKTSLVSGVLTGNPGNAGANSNFGAPTGSNATIDISNGAKLNLNGCTSDRNINCVNNGAGTVTVWTNVNTANTIGGVTATGTGTKTVALLASGGLAGALPALLTVTGAITNTADSALTVTCVFDSAHASNQLTLNGVNTFTGGLTIGQAGASSGVVVIGSSGSLNSGNYAGAIVVNTGSTLKYSSSATQTLSGVISGAGSLTKDTSSSSVLTLSNTNTYTGATTVTAGTLLVTGVTNVSSAVSVTGTLGGSGTVNGATTLASGGAVAPGTGGTTINTLNTAAVTFVAGSTYSVDLDGTTPSCDKINSTGTVALGAGVTTLTVASVANSAVGKVYTIVSAATSVTGTFSGMANGATFTQAGRNFLITYTSTAVTLTDVPSLNTKVWNGGGGTNSWILATNWVGGVAPVANDDLVFAGSVQTSPTNDFAADTSFGSITFATGASAFTLAAGNRITLTGNIINSSSNTQTINIAMIANVATVTVDGSSNIVLDGIVSETGGARALTKTGTGTLTMSAANSYTGTTTISAGTLQIGNAGTTGALSTSSAIVNNATLTFNRTNTITQGTDFITVISGSGAVIQMGAAGTLVLNGANTYTGTTSVQDGTLSINTILDVSGGASAVGAPTTAGNGTIALGSTTTTGTLVYTGMAQNTNRVMNLAGTTGGGVIDQSGTGLLKFTSACTATGAGAKTLTLQGSTAGTGEISAAIVDSASATALTKAGTGTWTLSGTNTYTGATTVSAGTLLVTGSTHASSAVAVDGTGTLGGTGTVNGTITMAAGGTLAPGLSGVSIGTLLAKTTTMHASSIYSVDVSGASSADVLSAAGQTVTCAGTLTVASNAGAAVGNVYTIISAGTVTGTFSGLANNAVFVQGGRLYRIVYTSTTVTLTDVAPVISSRGTRDVNVAGNGKLDRIRLTFDQNLNGDVSGLIVTVAGYTVTGFDTATGDAAVIDVVITELGSADTGATPLVRIVSNSSLKDSAGTTLVQGENAPGTAATDTANPVLLSSLWTDGDANGVDAGDTVTLTFSESVTTTGMAVTDVGLPLSASGDTLSTTAIGNQSGATISMTLAGTPRLTPGGTYSSAALTAGKPSGVFIANGAAIADAVALNPAVGNAAVARDLTGSDLLAIAWVTGSNPKAWAVGSIALGATANTTSAVDLALRNVGDSTADLSILVSVSAPSGWTPAGAAGTNQFLLKVDNAGLPAGDPTDPSAYELTLSTTGQPLVSGLLSGLATDFEFYLRTPTTITAGAGVQQTTTVTITAALPP